MNSHTTEYGQHRHVEIKNLPAFFVARKGEKDYASKRISRGCFEIAAENGNDYAEYQLGKIYLYGDGVPKDCNTAIYYLHLAADHGNNYAAQLLYSIQVNGNWMSAIAFLRLLRHTARTIQNRMEDECRSKNDPS